MLYLMCMQVREVEWGNVRVMANKLRIRRAPERNEERLNRGMEGGKCCDSESDAGREK